MIKEGIQKKIYSFYRHQLFYYGFHYKTVVMETQRVL